MTEDLRLKCKTTDEQSEANDNDESTELSSSSDEDATPRNVKRLKPKLRKQTNMANILAKGRSDKGHGRRKQETN